MNKKNIIFIIIALIISSGVFFVEYTKDSVPQSLYRVYLSGKSIGYIESKKELEEYINEKEKEIKNKYNVDTVYAPKDLDIVKEVTYNKKINSLDEIYKQIKTHSPFTISGYTIVIKGVEEIKEDGKYISDSKTINVLDKKVFESAVSNMVDVFVDKEEYKAYVDENQKEITDTGKIIEKIYIENEMTIKQNKISTDDMIFTDESDLSKYLLFGTLDEQKKYTVKEGDTIEKVSYDNKLSVEEFLIANTEFNSSDNLLYPGEEVTLGIIRPAFKVVEEDHIVEIEASKYKTEIIYDDSVLVGIEYVKQKGENGKNKVTKKVKVANGEVVSAVVVSSEEVIPAKNKIVVRGKGTVSVGSVGDWAWPTRSPYVITSNFGWRWGTIHDGMDISGTGLGSPIYAANDGVVVIAGYTSINGNYIIINHNNGYYTLYAHMQRLISKKGDIVSIGQQIGTMGSTGFSTGPHLHFAVWKGYPYRGGVALNPLSIY